MRFDDLRATIQGSAKGDWHTVNHPGPTYRDRFAYVDGSAGYRLENDSHLSWAAYKPDLGLTLAWGMTYDFDFMHRHDRQRRQFAWSENFPDDETQLYFADFFWSGALVERVVYISVDGGRGVLPWASEHDGLKTTQFETDVARLVHQLSGHVESFDEHFRIAGFVIADPR